MIVNLLRKIVNYLKLGLLDKNEKKFVRQSPFLEKTIGEKKDSVILVQMPMDYFYVSLFSLVGQQLSQDFNARLIGLWPHNVQWLPIRRNVISFKNFIAPLYLKLSVLLTRRKWANVYRGAGVTTYTTLNHVSVFENLRNSREAVIIWASLKSKQQLINLVLNGVHCGDLIYDTYIRFRAQPTVNLDDPYLKHLIKQCLNAQLSIRKYLNNNKVNVYLSSYASYIQHGIPVREALQAGVVVYTAGTYSQYLKRLAIETPLHVPDYLSYANVFALLEGKDRKLEIAKNELEKRFSGSIDEATRYMQATAYGEHDSSIPEGIEGVVFLHDFFDSPHCYRSMLFEDFWEWAVFTLRVIQDNGLKIAVKPHPNQVPESIEAVNKLKQEFPDIIWLEASVSNKSIMKAGITCGISVYGTILHELAYHGIAAIAAGDHPHIAFDIAITPTTRDEYKKLIINFKSLIVAEEARENVLEFYYMHNIHDKEDLITKAPELRLREMDPDSSSSLIKFLGMVEPL